MKNLYQKQITILEVVVVITILLILGAMLLPPLSHPNRVYMSKCLNNIKQIGTGLALYSSDVSYGVMPNFGPMKNLLASNLISDPKVFYCPKRKEHDQKRGDYLRSGNALTWAHDYNPKVVIAGDQRKNHDMDKDYRFHSSILLFKDGHALIHRFDEDSPESPVTGVKGLYSADDDIYSRQPGQSPETDTWLNWKE